MKTLTPILILLFSFNSSASPWDAANSPFILNRRFVSTYSSLPLKGELKDSSRGWPSSHWPNNTGSIAHRWSSGDPQNFKYKYLTLDELRNLEQHKIDELSPAEKFDIYRGDFSYPTVEKVFSEVTPDENPWHGICHGVAPASIHHPEPQLIKLTSKDGIPLTFYSSDISGLLSYFYARMAYSTVRLVGNRCNSPSDDGTAYCGDINAGSFHIIMTNLLGIKGESYVTDTDRYFEVWNHVPIRFESREISREKNGRRIRMESSVTYAAAIAPKFYAVIGTPDATYFETTYEYYLDLNRSGRIIGGDWISERRPDFVWTQERAVFNGYWSAINQFYPLKR